MTPTISSVEFEHELYAERLRRKAQAEALATGAAQWTDQLDSQVRIKLNAAWEDAVTSMAPQYIEQYVIAIHGRTLRSMAKGIKPNAMKTGTHHNDELLSLVEAQHEVLKAASDNVAEISTGSSSLVRAILQAPNTFRDDVNRILQAHIVAFHLHANSKLIPIDSHEMHDAVVGPTLYLLHSQPDFAGAEIAYQNALKELRNREAGDAITDAATALQDVLTALGCTGGALGDLLKSAKKTGLLKGSDTPLTEAIGKTIDWVAAKRNEGEAHKGDPDIGMSDAWMVVHVVGALIIRLAEAGNVGAQPETL